MDRMDYLARDSIITGVPFGRIDTNYILNNLDLSETEEILVKTKAQAAVEHFLLARYFMFKAIYQHHTIAGFESVVRNILFLFRQSNKIYNSDEIRKMIESGSPVFIDFNDGYIDIQISKYANESEISNRDDDWKAIPILCRAVKYRKPPKLIHEESFLKKVSRCNPSLI